MSANDTAVGRPVDAQSVEFELLTDDGRTYTLVPTDAEGDERLTHWLTVDADLLCDLEDVR